MGNGRKSSKVGCWEVLSPSVLGVHTWEGTALLGSLWGCPESDLLVLPIKWSSTPMHVQEERLD